MKRLILLYAGSLVCAISILISLSCGQGNSSVQPPNQAQVQFDSVDSPSPSAYIFPYKLNRPAFSAALPDKLDEISGLSLTSDGKWLLAVNDEHGKIFYLDKSNAKVVDEVKFGKTGDYEGVEMVGESIFIVRSNGTIYEVSASDKNDKKIGVYESNLGNAYDVEGLGFDKVNHRLLLACKGKAGEGAEFHNKRAVYAFDIASFGWLEQPVFLIDRADIQQWMRKSSSSFTKKLAAIFEPGLRDDAFAPSGIAVHPLTQEVYILSSVGKIIVVLNFRGEIQHIEPLDPGLHRQPEGIAFDNDGTLYISNEGRGKQAKLYRFDLSE